MAPLVRRGGEPPRVASWPVLAPTLACAPTGRAREFPWSGPAAAGAASRTRTRDFPWVDAQPVAPGSSGPASPGCRPREGRADMTDVATLAGLLREAEEHHAQYEPTAPAHRWSDWYAGYVVARLHGRTDVQAVADATLVVDGRGRQGGRSVALPVRPGRRRPGAAQPVQGDVVEHVVAGEVAGRLPVDERPRDLVVGVRVVVDHPGGQRDRGVEQAVADRLRPGGLLQEVAAAVGPERRDRVGGRALLLGVGGLGAAQRGDEQVRVDADQPLRRLAAHRVGDSGTDVATLRHVAGVAEAIHQLRPRAGDTGGLPAELGGLAGEAVAGQGWQYQVECIGPGAAVPGRIG